MARDEYALSARTAAGVVRVLPTGRGTRILSHDLLECGSVASLTRRDGESERPATAVGCEVDFGRQSAAGASEGMVGRLAGRAPFSGTG